MYTLFEHTADLGIRVEAPTLEALYADAACGLFAVIADGLDAIRATEVRSFAIAGNGREDLLVDWLSELLAAFELDRMLFCRFEVRLAAGGLAAQAFGEPLDLTRHRLAHEVKAITYHALEVVPTSTGWRGTVIVDI